MFQKVPGPSKTEINQAAISLLKNARAHGGKVSFHREQTPAGDREWVLMFSAAERLVEQNAGKIGSKSFLHFEFSING